MVYSSTSVVNPASGRSNSIDVMTESLFLPKVSQSGYVGPGRNTILTV